MSSIAALQSGTGELRVKTLRGLLDEVCQARAELLSPWLHEKHLSLLYAQAGAGKTFMSLSIALAVAAGGNLFGWKAEKPRKVLFVDGEMDVEDLKERCGILLKSIGGDPEEAKNNLVFLAQQAQGAKTTFPDLAKADGQNRLNEVIDKQRPALIILDNFSTLCDVEDENDASSFNPVINMLRELKLRRIATILVHHSRKDGGS
ncbi:MAG: AAA family ATPase [Rhodospirillales bacterium]